MILPKNNSVALCGGQGNGFICWLSISVWIFSNLVRLDKAVSRRLKMLRRENVTGIITVCQFLVTHYTPRSGENPRSGLEELLMTLISILFLELKM